MYVYSLSIRYATEYCSRVSDLWVMGHVSLSINTPLHDCFGCTPDVGLRGVELGVSDLFMVFWRKMLCKIICPVVLSFVPEQIELFSFYSIFYPIYIHIKSFRSLLSNS